MFRKCSLVIIFLVSFLVLSSFHKNETDLEAAKKFVVVLDAGHGGHDPGNLGNGYLEKDIALSIVKKVGAVLEKNKDFKVVYTREDDTFIGLEQRGAIANEAKADLFVSVHCNSHSSDAFGTETFVLGLHANERNFEVAKKENSVIYLEDNYEIKYGEYDINSPESVIGLTIMQEEFLDQSLQLAGLLQRGFKSKLKRKDRGPKQAGFIVLHQTFMPSVLIEVGFLTNKSEGAYLNSDKGQNEMSNTIAQAIVDYKNGVEAGSVALNIPEKTEEPIKEQPKKVVAEVEKTTEPETKEVIAASTEEVTTSKVPEGNPVTLSNENNKAKDPIAVQAESAKPITDPEVEVPEKIRSKPVVEESQEEKDTTAPVNGVTFKVQILATTEQIPLDGKFFNGLTTLSKEPYQNLLRYMYGNATSYQKAKMLKSNADAKGYTDSYIVAYQNDVRIPLWKALKLVSNE